ncbi:MAG: hypothetical protein OWS74_04065, partial [Firmicutes bacterium]|nr:hypothetical protein [Bacillota bacterium]
IFGSFIAVISSHIAPLQQILQQNRTFGVLLQSSLAWLSLMTVGLPLFDHLNPLVRHGLLLAPGVFAYHDGLSTGLWFYAALLLYYVLASFAAAPPFWVVGRPARSPRAMSR